MAGNYVVSSVKALERIIALVRQNADEPVVDAKYSDDDLLLRIESAFQTVLFDVNGSNDAPIMVRHTISVVDGSELFRLPPNVEQLVRIAKIDATTGLPEWWLMPGSRYGPCPGIRIEGQTLRFEPKWTGGTETLELLYVPSGDVRLHYGTAGTVTGTTVVLAATPTLGVLDTRENAYVGCLLRVVGATTNGYVQERVITAYDRATRTATLESAFTDTPATDVIYEVVPLYGRLVESVVAMAVAKELMAIAGNQRKVGLLNGIYLDKRRIVRQQLVRVNNILGQRFENDSINSPNAMGY